MLDEKWFPGSLAKRTVISGEELFNLKATDQVEKKVFLQAIDQWLKTLSKDQEQVLTWTIIGMLYIHMDDSLKAQKFLKKPVELEPNNPTHWDHLGFAYFTQGNLLKAIDHYKKAVALDYRRKETLNRLCYCYFKLDKLDKAKKGFLEVLELDNQDTFALYHLGLIYTLLESYPKAIFYFSEIVDIDPEYLQVWNNLGTCFAKTDLYEKAIECYEKVIEFGSKKADHWFNLGLCYTNLKQYEQASSALEQALELDPRDEGIRGKLLEVNLHLRRQGQFGEDVSVLNATHPKIQEIRKVLLENPEVVFEWKKENQKQYLQGVFDAKGTVFINETGQVVLAIEHDLPMKVDIYYRLLEKFGIQSIVHHNQFTEDLTEPSQLFIVGFKDLMEFYKQIGMALPTKKKRFLEAFEKYTEQVKVPEDKEVQSTN